MFVSIFLNVFFFVCFVYVSLWMQFLFSLSCVTYIAMILWGCCLALPNAIYCTYTVCTYTYSTYLLELCCYTYVAFNVTYYLSLAFYSFYVAWHDNKAFESIIQALLYIKSPKTLLKILSDLHKSWVIFNLQAMVENKY